MNTLLCKTFLILLLVLNVRCRSPAIRQTANGPVEGIELITSLGQKYYAFKGIPFAEPPITGTDPYTGEQVDRRFKAPEPLKRKWADPLKTQKYGNFCIASVDSSKVTPDMNEDCLFLNVYVPAGGNINKTVLLWLHGGGFAKGDSSDSKFGPDFLLSADNILVTFQYRLGIFGLLNLGFGEYVGNMALKDQQLALKWVYKNIEHFSGKKDDILLFGVSSGAMCVQFQMLNTESRKYFYRTFSGSGSAFSYDALIKGNNIDKVKECTKINNTEKLVHFLKTANSSTLTDCHPANDIIFEWLPTIESPNTVGAFITKTPEEIYNSDEAPIMDTLFSFTNKEYIKINTSIVKIMDPLITKNWRETNIQLPFRGFDKNTHPNEYKQAIEILRAAYFSNTSSPDEIIRSNIDLMSDIKFNESVLKTLKFQIKVNNQFSDRHKKTFYYRYSVDSVFSKTKLWENISFIGSTHADDVCYMFHCHNLDPVYDCHLKSKNKSYYEIKRMVQIITNFARTGNPSIDGDTPFTNCQSENEIYCQEISDEPKSHLITNIKEELHDDAWQKVEKIYRNIVKHPNGKYLL